MLYCNSTTSIPILYFIIVYYTILQYGVHTKLYPAVTLLPIKASAL